jgi:hypothetical protein
MTYILPTMEAQSQDWKCAERLEISPSRISLIKMSAPPFRRPLSLQAVNHFHRQKLFPRIFGVASGRPPRETGLSIQPQNTPALALSPNRRASSECVTSSREWLCCPHDTRARHIVYHVKFRRSTRMNRTRKWHLFSSISARRVCFTQLIWLREVDVAGYFLRYEYDTVLLIKYGGIFHYIASWIFTSFYWSNWKLYNKK